MTTRTTTSRPSYPPLGAQLSRRLGTGDAVVIGLGAMVGAGVFAAFGPAAEVAGSGLLVGLAIAAVVAYANATSSAQLAALHPAAGGTYVYATVRLTRVIVAVVLVTLTAVVFGTLGSGNLTPANLGDPTASGGWYGILQAGGLLFFTFAGYARIATLGEEVVEPETTIPRTIPLALGITLVIYVTIAIGALLAAGPDALAASDAPLAVAVEEGRFASLVPTVRIGAAVASLGVLLSLLVRVSRTTFAMARDGHLPATLARASNSSRVPHVAEVTVGVAVIVLLTTGIDLRGAIGFSSFGVLLYYALANASALTLGPDERRWPRPLAALGVFGCLLLVVTLPPSSIVAGIVVLTAGSGAIAAGWRRRRVP